jgi:hypothetical protein
MNVLRPVGSTLSPKPAKPESQMMYRVDMDFAESTSRLVNRWGTLCTNIIPAFGDDRSSPSLSGHHLVITGTKVTDYTMIRRAIEKLENQAIR